MQIYDTFHKAYWYYTLILSMMYRYSSLILARGLLISALILDTLVLANALIYKANNLVIFGGDFSWCNG